MDLLILVLLFLLFPAVIISGEALGLFLYFYDSCLFSQWLEGVRGYLDIISEYINNIIEYINTII